MRNLSNQNSRESADGVVDFVAIKKDAKDKNKLRIILFQLKGGTARIKAREIAELKKAVKKVTIEWNYAEKAKKTVLFFKKDLRTRFQAAHIHNSQNHAMGC